VAVLAKVSPSTALQTDISRFTFPTASVVTENLLQKRILARYLHSVSTSKRSQQFKRHPAWNYETPRFHKNTGHQVLTDADGG